MTATAYLAGSPSNNDFVLPVIYAAGARHYLLTSYTYIKSKTVKRPTGLAFEMPWTHMIIDSGIFTMMFGGGAKNDYTMNDIEAYQDRYIEFIRKFKTTERYSFINVDSQRITGVQQANTLRHEIHAELPDIDFIDVWHLPDGKQGFQTLCEESNHIAVGVPELKKFKPKTYLQVIPKLCRLAHHINPDIQIHVLGSTSPKLIGPCGSYADTCDSSSWSSYSRFGHASNGKHIESISMETVAKYERIIEQKAKGLPFAYRLKETDKQRKATISNYFAVRHELSRLKQVGSHQ